MMINKEYTHFSFCCGSGSGSAGFNDSKQVLGNIRGSWRCIGGVDVDPDGLEDFHMMTGVKGTLLDLFNRDQYVRFHGKEPPRDWREATPEDIRRAAGNEFPYAVFISSPCKGATGLVAESMSVTPRYQALNELTLRCMWLMLEAWKDDPVSMIVFENVPRLASRGRHLLDQIVKLLNHFGYAVAETVHNCGEIGNLAQSRPRFLLVARHVDKVPAFLYQPQTYRLRPVGDVLGRMPHAGDIDLAGPMHRVPNCQWKTWLRLALVKAGSDWRSLNDYAIEDGYLRDYIVVPEYHSGFLGVHGWEDTVGTVAGRSGPTNGAFSVADPRYEQSARWNHGQQSGCWSGAIPQGRSPGRSLPARARTASQIHAQTGRVTATTSRSCDGTVMPELSPAAARGYRVDGPRSPILARATPSRRVMPTSPMATTAWSTGTAPLAPSPPALATTTAAGL